MALAAAPSRTCQAMPTQAYMEPGGPGLDSPNRGRPVIGSLLSIPHGVDSSWANLCMLLPLNMQGLSAGCRPAGMVQALQHAIQWVGSAVASLTP